MGRVRSKDSKIERQFRKELWGMGFRYRKNNNKLFGKPDISNAKKKIVIFIDSCFWHGCEQHLRMPSSNTEYWQNKIERNKRRDKAVNKYYTAKKWIIERVWEHDIKNNLDKAVQSIYKQTKGANHGKKSRQREIN